MLCGLRGQQQAGRKWGGCVAAGFVSWLLDELSRRETAWSNRSGARLPGTHRSPISACPRLILALGQGAMPDSDQRPEVEAPEELLADMPLPSDAKTFFLGGIFVLSMLTAAYVASEIVLPLIFAVMLNLLMQPALRALEGLRVPRALGALLLILVVIATIVGLGAAVSGPAEAWIAKLPEGIPRILERLRFLDAPINTLRTFLAAANSFGAAGPQRSSPGPFDGGAILSSVFCRDAKLRQPGCSLPSSFSTSSSFRVTVSCGDLSRSCPGSPASGRRSTSRSKSDAIFPPISSQLPL